jgi:hypothetical protein
MPPYFMVGTIGFAMIEMLFIYQLARNPLQAAARRWWCRSLFRASRDDAAARNARIRDHRRLVD